MDSTEAVGWGWTMSESTRHPVRRSLLSRLLALGFWSCIATLVVGFLGFLGFVYHLDRFEQAPETRADGIVAMTGGAQRIGDAIDLLAKGYAKRLLSPGSTRRRAGIRSPISIRGSGGCSIAAWTWIIGPATPSATLSRPGAGPKRTGSTPSSW